MDKSVESRDVAGDVRRGHRASYQSDRSHSPSRHAYDANSAEEKHAPLDPESGPTTPKSRPRKNSSLSNETKPPQPPPAPAPARQQTKKTDLERCREEDMMDRDYTYANYEEYGANSEGVELVNVASAATIQLDQEDQRGNYALDNECTSPSYITEDKREVVLELRGVQKAYPIQKSDESVVALKDINLCDDCGTTGFGPIYRGEFVMIRGPSGGGKTTLLNLIGTIDKPSRGTIMLLGEPVDKKSSEGYLADIRLRKIGFVFQTFNLIATMTAAENVELPMTLMGKLKDKERRLRARQLLALVGLRNRVNHLPSELSGGEQQRVTIARSLANNPAVLLLDEPTGDLDTQTTIEVMDLLLRINRMTRTTCIMVTHNPDVECYADRILYVSDGRFVKEARNNAPQRLDYDAYAQHLLEREQQHTQNLAREV